ncbi:hypothetical protein Micbo1qcDRAFT_203689 [Microdochium bolleyi]|uniref:Beta-glucuronidase C-terminal domain-containing protein n=1 Tax=Microdochium bolleyi TaxID=196109 RepID=A0A136J3E2_9PEZI|nr:hypothetical protein Micbo1qcDRAFT_203689 [Microdochium bolleyi]
MSYNRRSLPGLLALAAATATAAASISITVPCKVPAGAATLDKMPIAASFEFYFWPSYATNISLAGPCLDHLSQMYGQKVPIRIGGTTQDRATYDPNQEAYISYDDPDPLVPPMKITYGPKFFDLIAPYGAETILGFNRGDNNRTNTFEAILDAKKSPGLLKHLKGVEIGNEPDVYLYIWQKPIATPPWDANQEGADAADWAQDFINQWESPLPMLYTGSYAVPVPIQPKWPNITHLINVSFNQTVKDAVATYNQHLYALSQGTDLGVEMDHVRTAADLAVFPEYVASSASAGREFYLGETGFHGQEVPSDASFGAALQVFDKSLLATSLNIKRLYYHQGTINQASFNWFSSSQVEHPFYGGYLSALALHDADNIIAADNGTDRHARYVLFKNGRATKVVIINTEYYSGSGSRPTIDFSLEGIAGANQLRRRAGRGPPEVLRVTASSSDVTASEVSATVAGPTIGGQSFASDETCSIVGDRKTERLVIDEATGSATVRVGASEAVIVYL